jgi:hypothetical protein
VRYGREIDTVAGVLLLLAVWLAVTAWWTGWRAEEPRMPAPSLRGPPTDGEIEAGLLAVRDAEIAERAREEAFLATPGLAATAVVLLVGRRVDPSRRWAGLMAAVLVLVAVGGTTWGRIAPAWPFSAGSVMPGAWNLAHDGP